MRSAEQFGRLVQQVSKPANARAWIVLLCLLACPPLTPLLLYRPRLLLKAFGQHRQFHWTTAERLRGLAFHLMVMRRSPLVNHLSVLAGSGLTLVEMDHHRALLQLSHHSCEFLDNDQEGELELRWVTEGEAVWVLGFFLDQDAVGLSQVVITRNQGTSATKAKRTKMSKELQNLDFFRLCLWSLQGIARACKLESLAVSRPQDQCGLAPLQTQEPHLFTQAARHYREQFILVDPRLSEEHCDQSVPLTLSLPIPLLNAPEQSVKWRGRRQRSHQLLRTVEASAYEKVCR